MIRINDLERKNAEELSKDKTKTRVLEEQNKQVILGREKYKKNEKRKRAKEKRKKKQKE